MHRIFLANTILSLTISQALELFFFEVEQIYFAVTIQTVSTSTNLIVDVVVVIFRKSRRRTVALIVIAIFNCYCHPSGYKHFIVRVQLYQYYDCI